MGRLEGNGSFRRREMKEVQERRDSILDDNTVETEDTQKDKFLTFRVAKEDYGIEIRHVTEIVGIQKITEVPDMPAFIKGVINLRGKVISVMDVRSRFGLPEREYDERTCVIVVNVMDKTMGLVVDRVNDVLDIPAGQVEPPPETQNAGGRKYVRGIGKVGDNIKIILDVQYLAGVI
jgi:purine-binding chemotaxis protein CheW